MLRPVFIFAAFREWCHTVCLEHEAFAVVLFGPLPVVVGGAAAQGPPSELRGSIVEHYAVFPPNACSVEDTISYIYYNNKVTQNSKTWKIKLFGLIYLRSNFFT
jgi:hypothetical protein